jgi:hypothetical protein
MAVTKARRIERRNRRVDEEARGSERSVSQDPDKTTQPNPQPFYRTAIDDVVLIGYWEAMAMTSQGPLLSTQGRD